MTNLGYRYQSGIGIPVDYDLALKWFKKRPMQAALKPGMRSAFVITMVSAPPGTSTRHANGGRKRPTKTTLLPLQPSLVSGFL